LAHRLGREALLRRRLWLTRRSAPPCRLCRRKKASKSFLVFERSLPHLASVLKMNPKTHRFMRFLQSWVINTAAVLVAAAVLHNHISYDNKLGNLLVASLLLGILNAFVRPILMLIALPLLIFTLGLFTLVINALLLYAVGKLLDPMFHVDSFGYAFLGALIISVISMALNVLTGNARVSVDRRRPPGPPGNPGAGSGPVIDV
jgi:putative membrane protein